MKILMSLAMALALVAPLAAAPKVKPVDFQVSKVGKDKAQLLKVFEAVRSEHDRKAFKSGTFEIFSKVSETRYLVHPRQQRAIASRAQSIGGGGGFRVATSTDTSTTYLLDLAAPADHADGDIVGPLKHTLPADGATYKHRSANVRIIKQVGKVEIEAASLTKEKFVELLKKGETFTCSVDGKCSKCLGFRRISPLSGVRGGADGKIACPGCKGSGTAPTTFLVKW